MSFFFAILVVTPLLASFASPVTGAPGNAHALMRREDKVPEANTTCHIDNIGESARIDMIGHLINDWNEVTKAIPTTMAGECTVPYCHCGTQAKICATGKTDINLAQKDFAEDVKKSFEDCSGVYENAVKKGKCGKARFRPFRRDEPTYSIEVGTKPEDSDTDCPC